MFGTNSGLSASDVLALSNNDGFGNGNGAWWLIIVLFALFGWGGNGFGGGYGSQGAAQNYVLASDFATIQRQLSDGFNSIDNALDRQNAGICDLGYTSLNLNNQTNTNMMQGFNALQSQLAQCCCDNREAIAGVNYNMQNGFCQTNYNNATNTRDIIDSQTSGTQAILAKLSDMESNAQQEKIASLQAENQRLAFAQSQSMQNSYLINTLRPSPIPSYQVQNPYCSCGQIFNGYYGTTIA